jgi:hypothetical protein
MEAGNVSNHPFSDSPVATSFETREDAPLTMRVADLILR